MDIVIWYNIFSQGNTRNNFISTGKLPFSCFTLHVHADDYKMIFFVFSLNIFDIMLISFSLNLIVMMNE